MAGELNIGIVGSTGSDPRYDPFLVVNRPPAKEVIHALIRHPLREEDLCAQLERNPQELKPFIEDLLRIGAVRRQADQIWLNFPLITKEDQEMITAGSRRAAGHLSGIFQQEILQVLKAYRDSILDNIGRLLESIAADPCSERELERRAEIPHPKLIPLLKLLVKIDYLSRENQVYRLLIPFFSGKDLSRLQKLIDLVKDIVSIWAREHYEGLRSALQSASPLRNDIPFSEFFNLVWHSIFARANRILAESNLMLDSLPRREGEGRYVAWVIKLEQHFYRKLGFSGNPIGAF